VLIFDEIVTGFRHDLGGVQKLFGVTPDLTTFGKAVANGYPVSGLGGRNDIMSLIEPEGKVSYSGTFNGLLISMVAALKAIELFETQPIHERLFAAGRRVADAIGEEIERLGLPAQCRAFGSVWCLYFTDTDIENYRDIARFATSRDTGIDAEFQAHLLDSGIYMQPYYANRCYISAAHTDADLDRTVDAVTAFLTKHQARIHEVNGVRA
jgi:glutamate-1-semialdehyde 2,1-aminomutase